MQQGLFVLAPFLVAGSVVSFAWLGWRRAKAAAAAIFGLVFFLSLTGVLPKLLGGYPPQLHLANSGDYYDFYYVQPEERAAVQWLSARTAPAPWYRANVSPAGTRRPPWGLERAERLR